MLCRLWLLVNANTNVLIPQGGTSCADLLIPQRGTSCANARRQIIGNLPFALALSLSFSLSYHCGQLFLNFDSFNFTSLALSVICTCIGLSLL